MTSACKAGFYFVLSRMESARFAKPRQRQICVIGVVTKSGGNGVLKILFNEEHKTRFHDCRAT
jgi:hypothetical protein